MHPTTRPQHHHHDTNTDSVLVYSEFAGCSTDFKGALIINPYDSDKVAESIHVALTMSSTTKQARGNFRFCIVRPWDQCSPNDITYHPLIHHPLTSPKTNHQIRNHQLSRYVNTYTSALWARRIISSLQQAGEKAREYNKLQRLDLPYLQARVYMCVVCELYAKRNVVVVIIDPGSPPPPTHDPLYFSHSIHKCR